MTRATPAHGPGAGPIGARLITTVVLLAAASACTVTPPATQGPSATTAAAAPAGTAPGLADVAAKVTPSVVTIRTDRGLGSGVVYRPDIVITNQHVVGDATDVTVDYADGTSSPGTVLATDAVTDIAVVRTARGGLPVPEYRPELPRPGETVLAIGSPLGFEGTVTAGVVGRPGHRRSGSPGWRPGSTTARGRRPSSAPR